ncbi:hypothetical protein RCC89_10545 [Cytophagaceae bacterium ABcell3]|nr:hypothetical protein RCC89_10545 [Cytophagaceae bacterium ABcell3]
MTKIDSTLKLISFFGLLLFISGCNGGGHHHTITQEVKGHDREITYSMTSEDHLENIRTLVAEVNTNDTFLITQRSHRINSHPCSNCHTSSLKELKEEAKCEEGKKKSHWNIHLQHASAESMDCNTCHNTKGDMDELVSLTGKSISVDHSYKQCAQCHSPQYKDWLGGSHGKRLGGWTQPRVINTCVDCHNPHKPSFEPRWPARINTNTLYPNKK